VPSIPRVALLLVSVGDLSGSGGTERQFSDLFEHLRQTDRSRVDLVTSTAALARLHHAGRLASRDGIVTLPLGGRPAQTRAGIAWLTALLLWVTFRKRWDVIHVCQPTPSYVPFCAVLSRLPRSWRPRLAITVVDCTLAHHLLSGSTPADLYERQVLDAHRLYFKWVRLDGVYSWYRAFVQAAASLRLWPQAIITAAAYCFTDTRRFVPGSKTPTVVFAGRLSNQKRPLVFVDSVASLLRRHRGVADGWRFVMYGAGPLEGAVRDRIAHHGLAERIELTRTPEMAPVFAASRLFVSTQAHENFTSLAMLEAMAAGNAVVAENVGQTSEFVKHGENGLLVESAEPDAFADTIADYLRHLERHEPMAAASRRLAADVQTIEHFAADITAFWRRMMSEP
jgi:glycosyltransferase involved in cell wall biosynthesis